VRSDIFRVARRRTAPHCGDRGRRTTPEVTKGALNLGAYQVMHKPFELHDLEPLLVEAFTSSRPQASEWSPPAIERFVRGEATASPG
jgi:hypothetical protein